MWYFKNFTKKNMFHWRKRRKIMAVLQVKDLKKYYGNKPNIIKALDGVSLTVERANLLLW